jgi:hypothetical protein
MQLKNFARALAVSLIVTSQPGLAGGGSGEDAQSLLAESWDLLLSKHVKPNGGVDYQGFAKDQADLERFIGQYGGIDTSVWDDKTKTAGYINLYNATMILNLLRYAKEQNIDVSSSKFTALKINDIKVPGGNIWNGNYKVRLAGQDVHLDNIEHDLIRGKAGGDLKKLKVSTLDPRIHAAVNCAALSCPRVREKAYRTDNLDAMLTENMKEYLSTEDQFAKLSDSKLKANQIVFWYYDDFEEHGVKVDKNGGAGTWLSQFVAPDAKDAAWKVAHLKKNFNDRGKISLKLSSDFDFHYNWLVNDIRNK